jgi:uncharacterized protein
MFATIVNCIAIIAGSVAGILFSRKINEEVADVISSAAGIVTLIIGFQMAFATENVIYVALSLILGGLVGTWWDIDGKILAIGRLLQRRFAAKGELDGGNRFAYAFLNASVLFCVGAMAIVGSFKAGTEGDYTMLYTKSVLDGFMSIVFGAAMGIGTAFSALSILLYQGALTLLSSVVKPWVSISMIHELTGIGGAFVIMIGINLLNIRKLKTANYLPGLIVIVVLVLLDPFIAQIAAKIV